MPRNVNSTRTLLCLAISLALLPTLASTQPRNPPVKIKISADKDIVNSGDPIDLNISMTNISHHDVRCDGNGSNVLDRNFEYYVVDSAGEPVPKIVPKGHETFALSPCIIKPGETARATGGRISGLFDFRRPGLYSIHITRGFTANPNKFATSNTSVVAVLPTKDSLMLPASEATEYPVPEVETPETAVSHSIWKSGEKPFTLTIGTDKPSIKAGSNVYVRLKWMNVSLQPVNCNERAVGSSLVSYKYEVRSEDGKSVQKRDMSLPYPGSFWLDCTIDPGRTLDGELLISWLYDLSKPGKYSVEVSRCLPVDSQGVQKTEWIKSNKITITVEK